MGLEPEIPEELPEFAERAVEEQRADYGRPSAAVEKQAGAECEARVHGEVQTLRRAESVNFAPEGELPGEGGERIGLE